MERSDRWTGWGCLSWTGSQDAGVHMRERRPVRDPEPWGHMSPGEAGPGTVLSRTTEFRIIASESERPAPSEGLEEKPSQPPER